MKRQKLENLLVTGKFKGKKGREAKRKISQQIDQVAWKEKLLNWSQIPRITQDGAVLLSELSSMVLVLHCVYKS